MILTLLPYLNSFLVACICILTFHGKCILLLPPPHCTPHPQIIFCGGGGAKNFFHVLFLGDLLYWEDLISFLGDGDWVTFFHKDINDESCKLKNKWWQNYLLHICILTFLTFTLEFSHFELIILLHLFSSLHRTLV